MITNLYIKMTKKLANSLLQSYHLVYTVHVHVHVIIEFLINAHLLYTGPAGTGKTESVKALGHQLGRFVLVFNCDETFDFQVQRTCTCTRTSINF